MSVARCYLAPARRRSNLQIVTGAHAERLVLDGARCTGVRYRLGERVVEARAGGEVIVASGAIGSPHLLELSGIGNPAVLASHGIAVGHALPGVGENLRDHLGPRMGWALTRPGVSYNDRARGLGLAWQALRYATTRRGFFSLPTAPMLAFVRSREGLASPDLQIHFMPYTYTAARKLHERPGMTVIVYQMRPESQGSVHLRDADARTPPCIRFNFLAHELDRATTVAGVRIARRIMATRALDGLRGAEFKPGERIESDGDILDWVRRSAETAFHPAGTCRMGNDPLAVVDERLRVHGLAGLRVADAAIMPTLTSGNTNAPCIMIGEKAASMILADAKPTSGA